MIRILFLLALISCSFSSEIVFDRTQLNAVFPNTYYNWTYDSNKNIAYINNPENLFAAVFRDKQGGVNIYILPDLFGEFSFSYYSFSQDEEMSKFLSPKVLKYNRTMNAAIHLRYPIQNDNSQPEPLSFYNPDIELPYELVMDRLINAEEFYFSIDSTVDTYFTLSLKYAARSIKQVLRNTRPSQFLDIALFDLNYQMQSLSSVNKETIENEYLQHGFALFYPTYNASNNNIKIELLDLYNYHYFFPDMYDSIEDFLMLCKSHLNYLLVSNFDLEIHVTTRTIDGTYSTNFLENCSNLD